jgi:hypothetical protein
MASLSSRNSFKLQVCLLSLAVVSLFAVGCGSGSTATATGTTGASFVVGTDAPPVANVTSFAVVIDSINATNSIGQTVSLVSGTPTVDFARFNGLQSLIDMNDVPVGAYTDIQIKLGAATIGYLTTASGSAPTIASMPATLTTSTVDISLANNPLFIQAGVPEGLRIDLDLFDSIQTSGGTVTGTVTPIFTVSAVAYSDPTAHIDEFDAAVVSVNTAAQSFVVQGPHGRQFTINVTGNTEWENSESLSSLTSSSIVQVSGTLDKADATIDADDVAILSQGGFFADGQVTYVSPASGTASYFDLYVRGLLPTTTSLTLGQIATVDVNGSENFFIYRAHNTLTQFLFNSGNMLPGQAVAIGGPTSGISGSTVTPARVVLRNWGYNGTVSSVPNSASGTFQMTINGFAGALVPQTVTVYTSSVTGYRNGFTAFSSFTNGASVRVVGLLIKDPTSGGTDLLARYVDPI